MFEAKSIVDKVTKNGKVRINIRGKGISGSIYFSKGMEPGPIKIDVLDPQAPEAEAFLAELAKGYGS